MVSANPTGPDHGRLGPERRVRRLGRAAARPSPATTVEREYYYNDAGAQMELVPRVGRGGAPRRGAARGRLPRRLRPRARRGAGRSGAADAASGSRRRSSASASTSTRGRGRASSSSACPSSCRGSTRTSTTARSGPARPATATTRTASLLRSRRAASRPTGRPTSSTSSTSSSAASTARSTCSAPTTTAPATGTPAIARMLGYDPERVEVLLYQLVHLTRGRRADEDVEAARRRRLPRRLHRRDRRRRGPLVPRQPRPRPDDRDRRRPRRRALARRTPSTTSSTRTRGSPGSCGTPPSSRSRRPIPSSAEQERDLVKRLAEFPQVAARGGRAARAAHADRVRDPRRRRLPPLLPPPPRARRETRCSRSGATSPGRRGR